MKERVTATFYDSDDNTITVTGIYYSGRKGTRDSFGAPMTPDDEPEMSLINAVDTAGEEVELSEDQHTQAIDALCESLT